MKLIMYVAESLETEYFTIDDGLYKLENRNGGSSTTVHVLLHPPHVHRG